MEPKNKKVKKESMFSRLGTEFRKIRWTDWPTTKKSFIITSIMLVVMSAFFFGVSMGITEFLKVIGAL